MWIFLLILKWIFIILGILLGLVLLFTALVLCVPVRYRAAGDNHEKIQYSFKKGQEEENFFQDQKSEEKEKQKKLFISRAIQYNEVCETKQETFETVVSGNKRAA